MQLPSKEEILKNGSVEVRVRIAGMLQRHTLTVIREQTAFGPVPYLVARANIPPVELVKLAQAIGLPLKTKQATVFPKGKMAKDFAGL